MPLQIPADQMEKYKRTARKRWKHEQIQRQKRREQAWHLARRAATLLKAQYNINKVVLFGSLTHPDRFMKWSDVDLAAWGLTSENWLQAMAAVRDLSGEIQLNLVDVSNCTPELLVVIEREGILL
jgi:predicted nucleotidyltransferase